MNHNWSWIAKEYLNSCTQTAKFRKFLFDCKDPNKFDVKLTDLVKAVEAAVLSIQVDFDALHAWRALVAEVWTQRRTICVGYHQIVNFDVQRVGAVLNAMRGQLAKELNAQYAVQGHEEKKKDCDIVALWTGALQNGIYSVFWKTKLEKWADDSDEDKWPGTSQ